MKTKVIFTIMLVLATLVAFSQNSNDLKRPFGFQNQFNIHAPHTFLIKKQDPFHLKPSDLPPVPHTVRFKRSPVDNEEIKYVLDSVMYYHVGDDTTQLDIDSKEEYLYNETGQLTTCIVSLNNKSTGELIKQYKTEYYYNAEAWLFQQLHYTWEAVGANWKPGSKEEISYNENGKVTAEEYSKWNIIDQSWIYDTKQVYTYDDQQRILKTVNAVYDTGQNIWKDTYKTEYTYYNSDMDSAIDNEFVSSSYDAESGQWVYKNKTENYLDSENNPEMSLYYNWNDQTQGWEKYWKTEYFYTTGVESSSVTSKWNNEDGWLPDTKSTYTLNENNEVQKFSYYKWQSDIWTTAMINLPQFNNQINHNQLWLPFFYQSSCGYGWFHHMLLEMMTYYAFTGGPPKLSYVEKYYYSEKDVSGTNPEISVKGLKVFPNPFTDRILFKTDDKVQNLTVEIFDLRGKLIISKIVSNGNDLDLSELKSGMYLYKINNSYFGKIIKR